MTSRASGRSATKRVRRALALALTLTLLPIVGLLGELPGARAADGDIDTSFGASGLATLDFPSGFPIPDYSEYDSIVDASGRLLVVGGMGLGAGQDAGIVRFAGGTLDRSFQGGFISVDIAPDLRDTAKSVAVQADGKIVIAGDHDTSTSPRLFVARLLANGTLDPSFAGDGLIDNIDPLGRGWAGGGEVDIVDVAGVEKIVLGSWTEGAHSMVVTRFNLDGTIDTSFDGDGNAEAPFRDSAGNLVRAVINDLDAGPSGTVVVSGHTNRSALPGVARFTAAGLLDTTFGTPPTGAEPGTLFPGPTGWARGIDVAGDGSVAIAHWTGSGTAAVTVLNGDGTPNTAYGLGGTLSDAAMFGAMTSDVRAVRWDTSGGLLLAGSGDTTTTRLGVARLSTATATYDTAFSGDGRAALSNCAADAGALSVAFDADRILAVGTCGSLELGVAAFTPSGDADTTWGGNGFSGFVPQKGFSAAHDGFVTADGGVLLVGTSMSPLPDDGTVYGGYSDLFVAKLDAAGNLDRTFNTLGHSQLPINGLGHTTVTSAAVDSSGRILVAGTAPVWGGWEYGAFVARLLPTGQLDTTFGAGQGWVGLDPAMVGLSTVRAIDVVGLRTSYRIAVAGGDGTTAVVGRLLEDGTPDIAFGGDGLTSFTGPAGPAEADAVVLEATGNVIVAGSTYQGPDYQPYVARFTPAGDADTSFNTTGMAVVPYTGWGAGGVVRRSTGGIAVSFVAVGVESENAAVAAFTDSGALDTSFASGGVALFNFENDLAFQHVGRLADAGGGKLLVAGTAASSGLQVARLNPDGTIDTSFSANGVAQVPCMVGLGHDVILDAESVVVTGECDGRLAAARFLLTMAPSIANLGITVAPSPTDARTLDLPITDLDRTGIMPEVDLLGSAPVRNSPVRNSPVRNSPVRNSPVRNSPVRNSPVRNSTLPPILLSAIPLYESWDGGWQGLLDNHSALANTELQGLPAQNVSLQQLPDAALTNPDGSDITLAQIDLSATPVRNSSLGSLLFASTTLASIPVRNSGDWCTELANEPYNCTNGVDPTITTLLDLELGGDDLLSLLWRSPLSLLSIQLHPDSPLATMRLADISLVDTPMGNVDTAAVADLVSCEPTCATLAAAQEADVVQAGAIEPTARLIDVINVLKTGPLPTIDGSASPPPLTDLTLGQVIAGLIPPEDFPYETIPLDHLLSLVPAPDAVTYTVSADLRCDTTTFVDYSIELPPRFQVVPDSGVIQVGATTIPTNLFYVGDGPNVWQASYSGEGEPLCSGTDPQLVTLSFQAIPTNELAVTQASVSVMTTIAEASAHGAHLSTEDPGEPANDDPATAPTLAKDRLVSGYLSHDADVDYYLIPAPAEGSVVTAILSHLPADFDAVLFGAGSLDDPQNAPVRNSPVRNSPVRNSPVRNSPVEDDGLEYGAEGNTLTPETLQDIPVRNSPVRNSPVRSSSTNRGTADERVSTTIREGDQGENLILQISRYAEPDAPADASTRPYVLRLKVTPPIGDLPCITRNYTGTGVAGVVPAVADVGLAQPETLILFNQSRTSEIYGAGTGEHLATTLAGLADHPAVNGVVVPVDGDAGVQALYDHWDNHPCSVDAANSVVGGINTLVDTYREHLGGLKHIVLVGSDEVIPHARIPDLVELANQRDYRFDAVFNGLDNPISRAFARGNILSDDPYGDFDPAPWLAGQLYLPDVALGRLVETPAEITALVNRFLDSTVDGRLDASTSYTTGYDFLADGATEVDAALRQIAQSGPASQISETWSRTDVLNAWAASPDLQSVNAHYDHYRALPALGNADHSNPAPELITSGDLFAAQLDPGSLLFTMGCNAGVNIADVMAAIGGTGPPGARSQDWAQVAAQKVGALVANGGYGYGDTEIVAYSEELFANFARNLNGAMTVGQALALAKHQTISALGVSGVYNAKAVEESIFFGLPMYRLGAAGTTAAGFMPDFAPPANTGAAASTPFDINPNSVRLNDPSGRGDYWHTQSVDTTGGLVNPPAEAHFDAPQITHGRPITPRVELPFASPVGQQAHGVLLEGLVSNDTSGVDPVYAVPTIDLAATQPEPVVEEVFFPSAFANLTITQTPGGVQEKLVLLPGQFFTPDGVSTGGLGTQRLFTRMAGTVLHSDSADFVPPQLLGFQAHETTTQALFAVDVPDTDATRVLVLFRDTGSADWRPVDLVKGLDGRWTAAAALSSAGAQVTDWLAQAVDAAGNVGTSTNKGRFFEATPMPAVPADVVVTPGPGTNGYYQTAPVITLSNADPDAAYEASLNGGLWQRFDPATGVQPAGDGVHTVAIRGSDGTAAELVIAVDSAPPVVTITTPGSSSSFFQGETVVPEYVCADAGSGLATCEVTAGVDSGGNVDTSTVGTHTFAVTATDIAGNATTEQRGYEVIPQYTFEGFFSPVNNPPVLNSVKGGATVPVKFRLRDHTGAVVSDTSVITSITSRRIHCDSGAPTEDVEETTVVASSGLSYDPIAQQFVYTWKTYRWWGGTCRQLEVTFPGATQPALFKFK